MCGEKRPDDRWRQRSLGSPPRVRGKGSRRHGTCRARGITPACAGKSSEKLIHAIDDRDHPRVCGEKAGVATRELQNKGSPPRVRGKASRSSRKADRRGITPACAGKSCKPGCRRGRLRDHPRVCGEKHIARNAQIAKLGSPPRVRGKEKFPNPSQSSSRITPACAGKSKFFSKNY